MQYFTPLSASSFCRWIRCSLAGFIDASGGNGRIPGSSCAVGKMRIVGVRQRRRLVQPFADEGAQVRDHRVKSRTPLVGAGAARKTGGAVRTGAVDRMREHAAFG